MPVMPTLITMVSIIMLTTALANQMRTKRMLMAMALVMLVMQMLTMIMTASTMVLTTVWVYVIQISQMLTLMALVMPVIMTLTMTMSSMFKITVH